MKRSFMFICAAALLLTGCGASADEASAQLFAMDTVMQLDAYGHQVKQAVSDAEETIQALEARLSRKRRGTGFIRGGASAAFRGPDIPGRHRRRFRYYYRAGDGRLGLHRGQLPRPRSG